MKHLLASLVAFVLLLLPGLAQGPTIDAQGWTEIPVSPGAAVRYVDPSRPDDSGDGKTPGTAEKTIGAALDALPDRTPARLRLKSGATFPTLGKWLRSGLSADEPFVVEVYGGLERAKIRTKAGESAIVFEGGGGSPSVIEHVAFMSLDLEPTGRVGNETAAGVKALTPLRDILIEDCAVRFFHNNLLLQGFGGDHKGVRIRRTLIVGAWNTDPTKHSNGVYAENIDGLAFYECLFHHNGFASPTANTGATIYRHNFYGQSGSGPVTFDGCVVSFGSDGLMLRSGGAVRGCLFTGNPISLILKSPDTTGSYVVLARGNVILNGRDLDAANKRGWGIELSEVSGARVSGNLLAHNAGGYPQGIVVSGSIGTFGVENAAITGNTIHDWKAGVSTSGGPDRLRNVTTTPNEVDLPASTYVDPTANVPPGYVDALLLSSKADWPTPLWPSSMNRKILAGYAHR